MKHCAICFLSVVVVVLFATGCGSLSNRFPKNNDNYDRSIRELATYMMRETGGAYDGIWVVEPLHAESGFALRLDDRQVVFLKYNPKLKKMKRKLDYVDDKGYLYIAAYKFYSVRNGCFVMLDYKGFKPETREKLLKAFGDF